MMGTASLNPFDNVEKGRPCVAQSRIQIHAALTLGGCPAAAFSASACSSKFFS
jgi:hypothetical protein